MNKKKDKNKLGFFTRAIHSGQEPDEHTGALVVPINLSTSFAWDGLEKEKEHTYTRSSNPTRAALQTCVADLENAKHGFAFSSGVAAIDSVLRLLKPGDHLIFSNMVYGGTIKLLQNVYQKTQDITFDIVDLTNSDDLTAAMKENTKMVWVESPGNPFFNIVDLAAVAKIAHSKGTHPNGALCVADNTVASPYLQNPLSLGVDIVVHSATKYMGGHSDVLGGIAVTNSDELAEHLHTVQTVAGAVLSPFDSYMVLRGIKTLGVRMERQCQNALAVAEMLEAHPEIQKVNYAGLKSHPGHSLAKEQMRDFGGMMSVHLKNGREAVSKLTSNVEIFVFAESLGAVESIISHPASMPYSFLAGTEHEVDDSMVRLSVGIENADDLIADLQQALA